MRGVPVRIGPGFLARLQLRTIHQPFGCDHAFESREPIVVVMRAVIGLATGRGFKGSTGSAPIRQRAYANQPKSCKSSSGSSDNALLINASAPICKLPPPDERVRILDSA